MRLRSRSQKLRPSERCKVRQAAKRVDPFYQSAAWVALCALVDQLRGKTCKDPDHNPLRPRAASRLFHDHVVELRDGGAPLDPANILQRCGSCHTRKTAAERARRLKR